MRFAVPHRDSRELRRIRERFLRTPSANADDNRLIGPAARGDAPAGLALVGLARKRTPTTLLWAMWRAVFERRPLRPKLIIDNDNFSKVVDDAESRTARPVLRWCFRSIPERRIFTFPRLMSLAAFRSAPRPVHCSPIRWCWTSCRAPNWPSWTDRQRSMEIHCRSRCTTERSWELREVVIGLTIVRRPEPVMRSTLMARRELFPRWLAPPRRRCKTRSRSSLMSPCCCE